MAEHARSKNPTDPDIADTLGWILYERGTYGRALALLKEAASAQPENALVQYHLGFANNKRADFNDAIRAFDKALASGPELGNGGGSAPNCSVASLKQR